MATVGNYLLWFGIGLSVASTLALFYAALRQNKTAGGLGRFLFLLFFGVVLVISGMLLFALITGDYSLQYVQRHVANDLNLFYRISAFWGGQAGSLIFWVLVLSFYGALVCLKEQDKGVWVQAVVALISAFFITLTIESNPFVPAAHVASDGMGLNPLLRNLWMVLHPPAIYLGYVGSALPFAYIVGAYANEKNRENFLKKARIWALFSWAFLGLGIFLGGRWAYVELGWGGYWAWDPVENASLIPWFFGTAMVHSVMVQRMRKNAFSRWAYISSFLFFFMSLTGTFLTRSGVIQSVHAFGFSKIAYYFYVFMILITVFMVWFGLATWKKVEVGKKIKGFLNRENLLSLANWILFLVGFGVLAMTLIPPIASGKSLEPKVFDAASAPFMILFVAVMGLAVWSSWAGVKQNIKRFWIILGLSLVSVVLFYFLGIKHPYGLLGALPASFLGWAALFQLASGLRRFYLPVIGAQLSHLGIAVIAIGIIGSHGEITGEFPYQAGQRVQLADYTLEMGQTEHFLQAGKHQVTMAQVNVLKDGKLLGTLRPTSVLFAGWERMGSFTDVDILPMVWGDIYSALYSDSDTGYILLAAKVPLIQWLWIGCWLLFFGSIIPVFAKRRK